MEFIWLDQTRLPSCTELASGLFAFLVKTLLASRWVKPGKNPLGITKGRGEGRVRDMMHQVSAPPVTSHISPASQSDCQCYKFEVNWIAGIKLTAKRLCLQIEQSSSVKVNWIFTERRDECFVWDNWGARESERERRSLVVGWWSHNVRMG